AMGQKDGKKWTAAADLQPTISKCDRLPGSKQQACCNVWITPENAPARATTNTGHNTPFKATV
ncbi:MAG: hypothetical protein Q8O81_15550, partial [Giesbergeria sp.]|nr:hypothetical protein [Giesbergeria sp.]